VPSEPRRDGEALPALVRVVAIPVAGVLLFLFFLHLGFPYDRLAGRVAALLGRATHSEIEIAMLAPKLSLGGPGISATGVRAVTRDGTRIELERAFLRPAWSLAWLRGNPAVYLDLASSLGEAKGVATLRVPGFHGTLRGIDLARLPLEGALPGAALSGKADLDLDLELAEGRPRGETRLAAGEGSLALPGLPMELPFSSLAAELAFGGARIAEISSLNLKGPLLSATAKGKLGQAEQIAAAPLQLDVELTAQPAIAGSLQAVGISTGPDGKAHFQITGTPAQPIVR
jgi:type II secretion system protein N